MHQLCKKYYRAFCLYEIVFREILSYLYRTYQCMRTQVQFLSFKKSACKTDGPCFF